MEVKRGLLFVTLPASVRKQEGQVGVAQTGALYFYDWEPNVIGPNGKPAPSEGSVTGDRTAAGAGGVSAGLTEYRAVLRAARRPPILRDSDTTWKHGCTARQAGGCTFGSWYLLDTKDERVLRGRAETAGALFVGETQADRYSGERPVAGAKAVRVNPGTVLVEAHPVESDSGKIIRSEPDSYYVLNDEPALTGGDLTNPRQGLNEGAGVKAADVTFGFNAHGRTVFERLTKEIAHRGQEAQLPGVTREQAEQHFAVVLEGQLITAPSIDFTRYPEGMDASSGSDITGVFTVTSARELANDLRSDTLPVRLTLLYRGSFIR